MAAAHSWGRPADRQRRLHMRGACEVGHGDVRTPIEPHRSRSQDGSRPVQLRPFLPNPPAHHRPWFESRGRAPLPTTPNASTPLRSTPARCKRPRVGTHWRQHVNHRTRRACSPWSYGARCAPRPGNAILRDSRRSDAILRAVGAPYVSTTPPAEVSFHIRIASRRATGSVCYSHLVS